jgi:hypothetical protein
MALGNPAATVFLCGAHQIVLEDATGDALRSSAYTGLDWVTKKNRKTLQALLHSRACTVSRGSYTWYCALLLYGVLIWGLCSASYIDIYFLIFLLPLSAAKPCKSDLHG